MRARGLGTSALPSAHTWPLAGPVGPASPGPSVQGVTPLPIPTSATSTRARADGEGKDMRRRQGRTAHSGSWRRRRRAWAAVVAAGNVKCWRCGLLIHPAQRWELGHHLPWIMGGRDEDATPEHFSCNRYHGGRRARADLVATTTRRW